MSEQQDAVFPYHRIVDDLRSAILSGRLAPGDRLSSEWELAEQYQTSRPTVRRAVAALKAEGPVITKQGRGAYVRPKPQVRLVITVLAEPRRIPGGALAVIEDPAGSIRRTAARSVDELTSRMPTPPEIDRLRLSPGVPVIRVLRTVFDTQGAPLEVQDSVAAADCHEFRYEVQMR